MKHAIWTFEFPTAELSVIAQVALDVSKGHSSFRQSKICSCHASCTAGCINYDLPKYQGNTRWHSTTYQNTWFSTNTARGTTNLELPNSTNVFRSCHHSNGSWVRWIQVRTRYSAPLWSILVLHSLRSPWGSRVRLRTRSPRVRNSVEGFIFFSETSKQPLVPTHLRIELALGFFPAGKMTKT